MKGASQCDRGLAVLNDESIDYSGLRHAGTRRNHAPAMLSIQNRCVSPPVSLIPGALCAAEAAIQPDAVLERYSFVVCAGYYPDLVSGPADVQSLLNRL